LSPLPVAGAPRDDEGECVGARKPNRPAIGGQRAAVLEHAALCLVGESVVEGPGAGDGRAGGGWRGLMGDLEGDARRVDAGFVGGEADDQDAVRVAAQ